MKYINIFIEATHFVEAMASFAKRSVGPTWFKDLFPGVSPRPAAILNVVWRALLTPMFMSFRINLGSKDYDFMSYQPNLVAR